MDKISVRGIEILFDESIPKGEIWMDCPYQGGKVRYMFNLVDHRMMQPQGEGSFFDELVNMLKTLKNCVNDGYRRAANGHIDQILQAMDDFKRCKDPRTLPSDPT